jgi:hypothetical protein
MGGIPAGFYCKLQIANCRFFFTDVSSLRDFIANYRLQIADFFYRCFIPTGFYWSLKNIYPKIVIRNNL